MAKHSSRNRNPPPLREVFETLHRAWGPQGWWPADGRLEMVVGAILTQNTAWSNVEKAIARLRAVDALTLERLHHTPLEQLTEWIRPAGYYNVKARRLRAFTRLVVEDFGSRIDRLLALPPGALRETLLGVHGIGPETADSILLYAAGVPVFVVDAYTRRFMQRHGWLRGNETYDAVARVFTAQLPADAALYNEFHALIVRLGKTHCRAKARCTNCPLQAYLPPPDRAEDQPVLHIGVVCSLNPPVAPRDDSAYLLATFPGARGGAARSTGRRKQRPGRRHLDPSGRFYPATRRRWPRQPSGWQIRMNRADAPPRRMPAGFETASPPRPDAGGIGSSDGYRERNDPGPNPSGAPSRLAKLAAIGEHLVSDAAVGSVPCAGHSSATRVPFASRVAVSTGTRAVQEYGSRRFLSNANRLVGETYGEEAHHRRLEVPGGKRITG